MLNAHCFLILHSMPQYSPCLFSECCFELTLTCFFVFKKKKKKKSETAFHFTGQSRSILQ